MQIDIKAICASLDDSIRQAMECIERGSAKVALVLDANGKLLDTITDGDIRRAILSGESLDAPLNSMSGRRAESPYPEPITAPVGTSRQDLLKLMQDKSVRHVPLVDSDCHVASLATLKDLLPDDELPIRALVMAGGFGYRMRPLTENLPKPMLPVGGRPLLELIIGQLRNAGISRLNVSTHYKGDVIKKHFGDGSEFDMNIQYVEESKPLGTAGAIRLVEQSDDPILVINGDILTQVDFRAMLEYHRDNQADMTVAVKEHSVTVPYGLVETDGIDIVRITEKPVLSHFINAGIYLLNPEASYLVPKEKHYDMPDLIKRLVADKRRVVSFPVHEYWMDIGQSEDYQRANDDAQLQRT